MNVAAAAMQGVIISDRSTRVYSGALSGRAGLPGAEGCSLGTELVGVLTCVGGAGGGGIGGAVAMRVLLFCAASNSLIFWS